MSVFIIDSNFLIEAHRKTYPLDIAHGFWNKVKQLAIEEKIISIDKVKNEIYGNEDDLKNWCIANLPNNFFKDTSVVLSQYSIIANWAANRSSHYMPKALTEFLSYGVADAYIIAFALADNTNRTVVTQEVSDPRCRNRIKIPEPCIALSVGYCNTIEMFRRLGETF